MTRLSAKEVFSDNGYKTKYFKEYILDGVTIDIISGMVLEKDNREYSFSLTKDDIRDSVLLDGVDVKLQSIDDWMLYYKLMDRLDKVNLINNKYVKKYTK